MGRRLRILVADDERDTVLTLIELLREAGHEARGVYRGGDVLVAMRQFDPHVVFLDLAMPDRSGWDVAREIRATYGSRPPVLIAISGIYKQSAERILGTMGEFNYYLAKPCDPKRLLSLLRHV
jgi:DNA-binding response OmpR family regulator